MAAATKAANLDDILNQVHDMPPEYLQCRDLAHQWDVVYDYRVVDSNREQGKRPRGGQAVYAERLLKCTRCRMKRKDAYQITSNRGHTALHRLQPIYDSSECPGYAMVGVGKTRGLNDIVRGEAFERSIRQIKTRGPGRPRKGA